MRTCLLLLTALLFAPGAALRADPLAELAGSGRVLLAPLNLGIQTAPELEGGLEPVWRALVQHFEGQQPRPAALDRESASALWRSTLAASSSEGAPSDVYEAYARFARRLAEQVDYAVLVLPSLVPRTAEIRGHQASWDGVHRMVEAPAAHTGAGDHPWIRSAGMRATLAAASLHVAVLTRQGELRYEGAGGLALLQHVELGGDDDEGALRRVASADPFADADALREGIDVAFTNPLPASRARAE